jgi:enoyl-CoA hydratase/carnithine racemase
MSYETILVSVDDGVATVTYNRPAQANAFNQQMTVEFPRAMWELERREDVRVIVVTGAGKAFCSGVDLSSGADTFGTDAHGQNAADQAAGVTADSITSDNAFWKMRTPVIGAINGAAVGAGLTTALLFDIRIVAIDAKLSFPFTKLGIISEANSTWLMPRLVGVEKTLELLLTGRRFTGEEAVAIGLALKAVPAAEVLSTALELARDIAASAPASVGLVKQLVYSNLQELDRAAAFSRETELTWWAGQLPDAAEGVMAFLERRPPAWTVSKRIAADWSG